MVVSDTTADEVAPAADQAPEPRAASRAGRLSRWSYPLVWVAFATVLPLVRAPGLRPTQAFWAEDGGVFYNEALHHSSLRLLGTTYAGYLQLAPRLFSVVAVRLPVSGAPACYAVLTTLTIAVVSLAVFTSARRLLHTEWAAALVAVGFVALPQAGFEVNGAANDLHWFLMIACVWVLLAPPRTRRGRLGACVLTVVAVLSDPLTVLCLPAAGLGWWRAGRDRRDLLPSAALALGAALQLVAHAFQGVTYRNSPTHVPDLFAIGGVRVVLSALIGDRGVSSIYPAHGLRVAVVAVLAVAVGLVALLVRAAGRTRVLAGWLCATSALFLGATLGIRGTAHLLDRNPFGLGGSRYMVVPISLLVAAMVVAVDEQVAASHRRAIGPGPSSLTADADRPDDGTARWPRSLPAIVLVAWLALVTASDWSLGNVRGDLPTWPQQLVGARAECSIPKAGRPRQPPVGLGEHVGRFDGPSIAGPDEVVIQIAPGPPPGGHIEFAVVMPCSRLRA